MDTLTCPHCNRRLDGYLMLCAVCARRAPAVRVTVGVHAGKMVCRECAAIIRQEQDAKPRANACGPSEVKRER